GRCSARTTASSPIGRRSFWRQCWAASGYPAAASASATAPPTASACRASMWRGPRGPPPPTPRAPRSPAPPSPTRRPTPARAPSPPAGLPPPPLPWSSGPGATPFHHHQHLNRLQRAWQKPQTVIVHESWWTPTARHADIVLPATTTLERNDVGGSTRDTFILA